MKKITLALCAVMLGSLAFAQAPEKCASMSVYNQHRQNPATQQSMAMAQSAARAWYAQHNANNHSMQSPAVITVPVVVHVLYKNSTQNISDQQIQSQITVLNQDYRRLNADTVNTPTIFDTIAADVTIEFCLAAFDPQGNPTNGITRTATQGGQILGYFSPFGDDAKFDSLGGKNAWPTDRYLNIWVCELFPGLLGYAQFPGDAAATDGVVITYTAFGTIGTAAPPSTLGRTATHEIGHWFGLFHIWGDDNDCVTGSDSIYDTPNASSQSPSDCDVTRNSCSNEDPWWGVVDPPDMVQNYMDYSNDSCMNMFTNGQKARMLSFLYGDPRRAALFNSTAGCAIVGVHEPFTADKYFSLYPNPTNEQIMVSYFGTWSSAMRVDVLDATGRTVRSFTTNAYNYTLDLSGLASGIYAVRFTGEGGAVVKQVILN